MRYVLDPSGRTLHWVMVLEKKAIPMSTLPPVLEKSDLNLDIVQISPHKTQFTGDRPYFRLGSVNVELTDRINDWLVNLSYPYQLDWRWMGLKCGVHVGFLDKGQAAHFKLTWAP